MVLISDCCMKQVGEISDEQVEEVEYDQMSSWGLVASSSSSSSSSSLHDGNKSGTTTHVLSATVRNPNSLHHNGFLLPICEAEFQEAACITPSPTDEEERSESCHKPEVEKADEKHVQVEVEVKAASITEEQRSESSLTSTHKTQIKYTYIRKNQMKFAKTPPPINVVEQIFDGSTLGAAAGAKSCKRLLSFNIEGRQESKTCSTFVQVYKRRGTKKIPTTLEESPNGAMLNVLQVSDVVQDCAEIKVVLTCEQVSPVALYIEDSQFVSTKKRKRKQIQTTAALNGGQMVCNKNGKRKNNLSKSENPSNGDDLVQNSDVSNMALVCQQSSVELCMGQGQMEKKKPKTKVYFDDETVRVMNLLNGTKTRGKRGNRDERTDDEKENWWIQERQLYLDWAESFINRVQCIQGPKKFTKWNGSVLDSVVGAFLSQNVSDHLSSSAFMSLKAHFRIKSNSTCKENTCSGARGSMHVEETELCIDSDSDQIHWQNKLIHVEDPEKPEVDKTKKDKTTKKNVRTKTKKYKTKKKEVRTKTEKDKTKEKKVRTDIEWDALRKDVHEKYGIREKNHETSDSIDWEAVRCADVGVIANIIKERGQQQNLAARIKIFLEELKKRHGELDLEWLRDAHPKIVKEYLLNIKGLGPKSVECVRLLTLHQSAFPVDTNVARITVRLGWIPLESVAVQMHELESYPIQHKIQMYLWPRLCTLDQPTLYELHVQMITFGKVFCIKQEPNCNECPMKAECQYYASAVARTRNILAEKKKNDNQSSMLEPSSGSSKLISCEPIIEERPEPVCTKPQIQDIEDLFAENRNGIPTIELNIKNFATKIQNYYMHENNALLKETEISKLKASIPFPLPKLKNMSRFRTRHHVYQLEDSDPLLNGVPERVADDYCPYLLAIWELDETPEGPCWCEGKTCVSCSGKQADESEKSETVKGTLLIPSRTALEGRFPLNGTYFQVNEVFADQDSSINPIEVPRHKIQKCSRRTVYFGTSIRSIFKGLSVAETQQCFLTGFVCIMAFNRNSLATEPLADRLHRKGTKQTKAKG